MRLFELETIDNDKLDWVTPHIHAYTWLAVKQYIEEGRCIALATIEDAIHDLVDYPNYDLVEDWIEDVENKIVEQEQWKEWI